MKLRRILAVEDVYGDFYEFINLDLSEKAWNDKIQLTEIAMNLIAQKTGKIPDITSINVLIVN